MRVEPHTVGSIMHVIKRGTRGGLIVKDKEDRENFIRSMFYLNDTYMNENWKRDITALPLFERPSHWPDRKPLVTVLAWTLLPNHFHLLLQEHVEGGIAKFMQRLCNSMTTTYNKKYKERGSLFQSAYRGKTVGKDVYLRQLVGYILVKNVVELYPGGISAATKKFNAAWKWGLEYPYSSFGATVREEQAQLIEDPEKLVGSIVRSAAFKKDAKELLALHDFRTKELQALALESWK